jgi:hypothetical protein
LQAAGEPEVIGRAEGYDVDGVVGETSTVLHFRSAGAVDFTAEIASTGDGNTLSGQYVYGEMHAGSKTKPMELTRVLNASPPAEGDKPGLNVSGAWSSHDWGKIQLDQSASQAEFVGKARGYDIDGFVTGTRVIMRFMTRGKLEYSVELTPKGDDALSGQYVYGEMLGSSKTKPIELTKLK